MTPDALKVMIYATWRGRLLVFDEPDFPEIELQVPGGTVEPGEDPAEAAAREFTEETGIVPESPLLPLAIDDYRFTKNDREIWHRRHYYMAPLSGLYPETWLHREMTPFDGGPPIVFRFSWTSLAAAEASLGYGMERCLHLLASSC
jgi:8-oxo-dGTP pyrophosphatase MutT (NUDIX family)